MSLGYNIRQLVRLLLWATWLLLPIHSYATPGTKQPVEFLFPADHNHQLLDVLANHNWKALNDGWIRENYGEYDFWLGTTPKVAWLKIPPSQWLADENEFPVIELASSGLSRAKLYYRVNDQWQTLNSDELLSRAYQGSLSHGIILSRFITFELKKPWQSSPIFLRVESPNKLNLQINIVNRNQYYAENLITDAFFFFCYGILFVMALYNFVIGRYLQDKLYYYYSLAIIATLLYQVFAHGHGRLLGFLDWDQVNYLLNFLAMLSALTALIFLFNFVNFKQVAPRLARYFKYFIVFFVIATFLTLFIPTNIGINVALLIAGPAPIIIMLTAIWAWYRGSKTAGVFVFAWSFYILGGFLWVLYWMGILTLTRWVELPLVAGAALESILLSLALGYRIQVMQMQGITLKKSAIYYKEISALDPMTKLANRRAFDQRIDLLLKDKVPFTLALIDIDNFKNYNDSYGHLSGDKVIIKLGEILQQAIRTDDMAARIGGDEFALVICNQIISSTHNITERIRMIFSKNAFIFDQQEVFCTVSVGIALVQENDTVENLIQRTDLALYRAKDKGRNQTQISTD